MIQQDQNDTAACHDHRCQKQARLWHSQQNGWRKKSAAEKREFATPMERFAHFLGAPVTIKWTSATNR